MKISKIMGKKIVVGTLVAAGALIAGSASAASLDIFNDSKSKCVRFYHDGKYENLPAGKVGQAGFALRVAQPSHKYVASVYKGACGGKAIRTETMTTTAGGEVKFWYIHD